MSHKCKLLKSNRLFVLAVGLTSLVLSAAAAADRKVDPTGSWKWERTFGDNTVQFTLRLEVAGDKVNGTYATSRGETKIEQAKLEGDQLSFQVRREFNDRQFTISFRGKVSEDVIKGQGEYSLDGNSREFDWQADRFVARTDVAGTWQLQVETLYADFLKAKVTFTEEGDTLKGDYSDVRGEFDVTNIEIKKSELTFDVSGENNGTPWKFAFRGQPRGDTIKGHYDYESGTRSGTLTFHGKLTSAKNDEEDQE